MATTDFTGTLQRSSSQLIARLSGPVLPAVTCSRLLVLAAGMWGTRFTAKVPGWEVFDPQGISTGMGSLGNLLAASTVRWDAIPYIRLAEHGYTTASSTVYFPLYPIAIRLVGWLVGSPVVAGVLISLIAFTIGLELVHRLTRWELGRPAADATVLLLAFSPFSFVFSAVYTGSLLFACAVGTLYLARQGRFALASLVAACGALTHIQGVLLVVPLAVVYWKERGRPRSLRGLWSPSLPMVALPPLALGLFFAYLHSRGWGWLAPITNQDFVYAGRTLVGTPVVVFQSIQDTVIEFGQLLRGTAPASDGVFTPAFQNVVYLAMLATAVLALLAAGRRLPAEHVLFGGIAILLCTSSAVHMEPLKGFDRYMLPIFPLWIGGAAWLQQRRLLPHAMAISTVLLALYTVEFTRWVSVF